MALERTPPKQLLDLGCGCGNLIEAVRDRCNPRCCETEWECCGCGNVIEISRGRIRPFQCYGIDISDGNVEAARDKHLENVYVGDSEEINRIIPPGLTFDMILFCGLLNRQVLPSKDKAFAILRNALARLSPGGYIIMTGYTSCYLTAEDLTIEGIEVLQKSLPGNLFRDYENYYLRQLYVGRKKK